MIDFLTLKNEVCDGKELSEIVEKDAFGYIPYIDDKIMENRGVFVMLTEDGVAIIPIEVNGLQRHQVKLAEKDDIVFLNNQLTSAIFQYENLCFLTNELEMYFEGEKTLIELAPDIDQLIISMSMEGGEVDFYDENGQIVFPNDGTYKHFYAIWKKEENLLTEGIHWINQVLDRYEKEPTQNHLRGIKKTIELMDVISWHDKELKEHVSYLVVQNKSGQINLIDTHTGIAKEIEFASVEDVLLHSKNVLAEKNEVFITKKGEWVIYCP